MAAASSSGDVTRKRKRRENYDVFLSFSGVDTRKGFTNTLFDFLKSEGIEAFIDDGLPRGQQIEASLVKTIEESRIAVVVFSKNYASSSWCLDELVKIREFNLKIMPIFYDVKPDHVLKLSGKFGKEFAKLKSTENEVKIKKWSNDLAFAATQAGWDLNKYSKEIDLIKEVTAYIRKCLHSDFVSACPSEIIGIDSLVNELQTLLTNESSGVKFLGLWGMGGIGKTTIADNLYHRLSEQFNDKYFCSLPLDLKDKRLLVDLRNKLISGILNEKIKDDGASNQPCALVVLRLQKKVVLIVLDNVSTKDQVTFLVGPKANRWFASGSKIIVTSRDSKVLENEDMEFREIKQMSREDSLLLFCFHAFEQNRPLDDEDYVWFSNKIVDYTKRLPLALKVLGRHLYKRTKGDWKSTLETLETRMNHEIEDVLMISYNNLSEIEKEIFLDVACFFQGYDKDRVQAILDGCGFNALITCLIEKCLVTLNHHDNTLGMHDLLQKMGQDIVKKQSKLGMLKRIRRSFDSYRLLVNDEEASKAIEGIFLNMDDDMDDDGIKKLNIHPMNFSKMQNLRLLIIEDCAFPESNESLEHFYADEGIQFLPDDLRVFRWDNYPGEFLPSNFPKNLVILEMQASKLQRMWKENKHSVNLKNLKVLDLSYSNYFTTLPDLTSAAKLERIFLDGCKNLLEIPASIQHLQSLSILSLAWCERLCYLPSLANISTLRKLDLYGCKGLKEFPETSKDIQKLILVITSVVQWPDSMSRLDNLKVLKLPKHIQKLPCTLQLKSLEELTLYSGKIKAFPEIIGPLRKLDLSYCDLLETLPDNFGQLNCLEELRLSYCEMLLKGPLTLSGLKSIKKLYLNGCRAREFPSWVCTLTSLQLLDLSCNDFDSVPNSITQLSILKVLNLSDCQHLRYLPEELPWQTTSTDIADGGLLEPHRVILTGCESLDEGARRNIVEKTMMRMQHVANRIDEDFICPLTMILSGCEIPGSFYRGYASSVAVELLTDSSTSTFRGLVIGVIADCGCTNIKFECTLKKADGSDLCSFKGKIDNGDTIISMINFCPQNLPSRLCLHYLPSGVIRDYCKGNLKDATQAAFRFCPGRGNNVNRCVYKCAVRVVYANHEV